MKLSNSLYRHADITELFDGNVKNGSLNYDVESTGVDSQKREKLNYLLYLEKERIFQQPPDEGIPELNLEKKFPFLNYYRSIELGDGNYFVSTDTGNWIVLSKCDYGALKRKKLTGDLKQRLEKNFVLLTEKNISSYIQKLRIIYGFLTEGPTLHIVVVTSRCNLRCIYCQASAGLKPQENMSVKTASETVERIFESPANSFIIEFQGGEPLLNFPVIKSIIEKSNSRAEAEKKRVEFSLISNFTGSATKEKLTYLLKNDVSICFSLDGPENLHISNRCANLPDGFKILKEKVTLYKKIWTDLGKGTPALKALMTTTRGSLHQFREIVDTYLDFGITELSIRPLTRLGKARDQNKALEYSPEEFLDFWKNIVSYVIDLRRHGVEINEFYLELILTKLFGHESGFMDLRSPCGAGYGQIVYNSDGRVYTCDEGRMIDSDFFSMGEIGKQSLNALLRRDKTREIFGSSVLEQFYCDYCAFKPYCGICPVLNYQSNGSLYGNILESFRCKVMSGMMEFVLDLLLNNIDARTEFEKIVLNVSWQKIE
jgi:His-Xaa-Ser system radical SAM maturase HxsB